MLVSAVQHGMMHAWYAISVPVSKEYPQMGVPYIPPVVYHYILCSAFIPHHNSYSHTMEFSRRYAARRGHTMTYPVPY
mgnify:CR=1